MSKQEKNYISESKFNNYDTRDKQLKKHFKLKNIEPVCKDEYIKIDNNIFFGNKGGDMEYYPASNVELKIYVDEFEDLEFESISNNKGEAPEMNVNKAYLKGFFAASYKETLDYDPNSSENQWARALGMNQQGKMNSSSFFCLP